MMIERIRMFARVTCITDYSGNFCAFRGQPSFEGLIALYERPFCKGELYLKMLTTENDCFYTTGGLLAESDHGTYRLSTHNHIYYFEPVNFAVEIQQRLMRLYELFLLIESNGRNEFFFHFVLLSLPEEIEKYCSGEQKLDVLATAINQLMDDRSNEVLDTKLN